MLTEYSPSNAVGNSHLSKGVNLRLDAFVKLVSVANVPIAWIRIDRAEAIRLARGACAVSEHAQKRSRSDDAHNHLTRQS